MLSNRILMVKNREVKDSILDKKYSMNYPIIESLSPNKNRSEEDQVMDKEVVPLISETI